VPVARDGVPDEEAHGRVLLLQHVDEDAAVAAVEGARAAAAGARMGEVGHRCGGGKAGVGVPLDDLAPVEEAEKGRGSVEGAVPAEEVRVAEGAEPGLADEGRAEEPKRCPGSSGGRRRRMPGCWRGWRRRLLCPTGGSLVAGVDFFPLPSVLAQGMLRRAGSYYQALGVLKHGGRRTSFSLLFVMAPGMIQGTGSSY